MQGGLELGVEAVGECLVFGAQVYCEFTQVDEAAAVAGDWGFDSGLELV